MVTLSICVRGLVAIAVLLVPACRPSEQNSAQSTSRQPNRQRQLQERLEPTYRVRRPHGVGPFPVILVVPGCSGFSEVYSRRAETLVRDGYVVADVDYLAAHGIKNACPGPENTKGESITLGEIGEYLLAAAIDLGTKTYVRGDRVFAVGSSLGGGGVLAALSIMDPSVSPIAAAATLYPLCRGVTEWHQSVPALLLLAGLDNITPPESCRELVARSNATRVTVRTLPNAHHAFDADDLPVLTEPQDGPSLGYNPAAAKAAWDAILAFFK